jgi:hypothetical protein
VWELRALDVIEFDRVFINEISNVGIGPASGACLIAIADGTAI